MTSTRSQGCPTLKYIRTTVLGDTPELNRIERAFNSIGLTTVEDLLFLTRDDLATCTINDEGAKLTNLELNKLTKILEWYATHPQGGSTTLFFELDAIKLSQFASRGHDTPAIEPSIAPTSNATSHSTMDDAVRDFIKGTKRDISHYEKFKDDKKWTVWNRHLLSTARTHGVNNVLNNDYTPDTASDIALFTEHQSSCLLFLKTH